MAAVRQDRPTGPGQVGRRTPGLSTPAGSTAALAATKASPNGPGRCRSYQGRCWRPTAWWWVMVPPAVSTASAAAAFTSAHCESSLPAGGGQHGEIWGGPIRVGVGEPAGHRAAPAHLGQGGPGGPGDLVDQLVEAVPGDRGLEGLDQDSEQDELLAQVRGAPEAALPGVGGRRTKSHSS